MESCAVALGQYNIRCNSVLPGTIETPINAEDLSNLEKRRYMESRSPLGRLGTPADIAGPAVFLASDLAQFSEHGPSLTRTECKYEAVSSDCATVLPRTSNRRLVTG